MRIVEYLRFDEIDADDFLPILNKQKIRHHLIEHELFNADSVRAWMDSKLAVDLSPGCKVRAVVVDKQLAGWCGIQLEHGQYEIAIVIDDSFWGVGKTVFRDIMTWAVSLDHEELNIHLLETRPEYKFLQRLSKSIHKTEMLGATFTSYRLAVKKS